MKKTQNYLALTLVAACLGCSQDADPNISEPKRSPDIDVSMMVLDEKPADAQDVIAARETAEDNEPVVVLGRIGGSKNPWIDGRAAFSIVDTSLRACSDIEGDECPYPWDYCCETDKLPTSVALVKFVDADGQLLRAGARDLFAVKELQSVVVSGTAQRDEAGNLTILADGIYIEQ